jgi:hypothetical protein
MLWWGIYIVVHCIANLTAQHPSQLADAVAVAAAAADAAAASCLPPPWWAQQLWPWERFPLSPQLMLPLPAQPLTPGLLLQSPLLLLMLSLLLLVLPLVLLLLRLRLVCLQPAALLRWETPPALDWSSVKSRCQRCLLLATIPVITAADKLN